MMMPLSVRTKNPTLTDVAQAAGVSRSSAARVLLGTGGSHVRISDLTRKRIEAEARKLQYTPNRSAQQLRGLPSGTIGVILDTENLPVMSQRLFALETEASRRGYRLLVGHAHGGDDTLREYVQDFTGRASEAILCLFDLAPGRDERAGKCFGSFRKVVFHGRAAWPDGYCVRVDTELALAKCVDHLARRGKRTLALSLWNRETDELMTLRQKAFEEHTARHGVRGFTWNAVLQGNIPPQDILDEGIDFMIRKCGADAILASNDIIATRFILQLQRRGLSVPEDVAVIGYDNLDIASVVSPSLTTIDQSHSEYAVCTLDLLQSLARGRPVPKPLRVRTISPRLIVRESA